MTSRPAVELGQPTRPPPLCARSYDTRRVITPLQILSHFPALWAPPPHARSSRSARCQQSPGKRDDSAHRRPKQENGHQAMKKAGGWAAGRAPAGASPPKCSPRLHVAVSGRRRPQRRPRKGRARPPSRPDESTGTLPWSTRHHTADLLHRGDVPLPAAEAAGGAHPHRRDGRC